MAAATWRHHFPDDVEFFEAFAIYEGLKMAKFWWDLYPLIIELDSQNVIILIILNVVFKLVSIVGKSSSSKYWTNEL